jgi:murein L,D-transpeptidase YafK
MRLNVLIIISLLLNAGASAGPTTFSTTRAQANRSRVKSARKQHLSEIHTLFGKADLDYPPGQVLLRVFKNEDVLELWVQPQHKRKFVHLKDYSICQRSGILGPKRQQGDLQVPEGFYTITAYNPASSFHLAMLVSYPNRSDRLRKKGNRPGSNICIHGDCVTIGCIPLTDRWIKELYLICLDTFTKTKQPSLVHSFPGRMHGEHWQKLINQNSQHPDLVKFWRELKEGYDRFEKNHFPARFRIAKDGRYQFK